MRVAAVSKIALVAMTLCLLTAASTRTGDLEVAHAWARPTVPSASEGVVYLTIFNHGKAADALTGVSTSAAKRAELHTSDMIGGMMQMRAATSFAIPAGGSLALEPGGDHIMLLGLTAPLKRGDSIDLTLTFERQGKVDLVVPVTDAAP